MIDDLIANVNKLSANYDAAVAAAREAQAQADFYRIKHGEMVMRLRQLTVAREYDTVLEEYAALKSVLERIRKLLD